MKKTSLRIVSGVMLFFFCTGLVLGPDSFAELPCWNDGSLTWARGGQDGATAAQKGDVNKKGCTKAGDPVDVANGNYSYEKQDIFIPSRGFGLK